MLNARLKAARRIAETLIPSEADIDTAIVTTSRLIAAIAEGRADTNLPVAMGQASLAALTTTMASLVAARGSIGDAHAALAQDRIDAGLRAYGMGDVSECPPIAGLKLVDDARAVA